MKKLAIMAALLVALSLSAVACGGDDPTATPTAVVVEAPPASSTPKFDALVEQARAAPKKEVVGWFEHLSEELLSLWEDEWEKDFGFRISITSTPGHYSSDSSVQILTGFEAGTAVGDYGQHAPYHTVPSADKGAYQPVDWEPLEEAYPVIRKLRDNVPDITIEGGRPLSDYCLAAEHVGYTWVYNKNSVSEEDVRGLTLEDLADPEWKDRLVMGAGGPSATQLVSGEYPGWDEERFEDLINGVVANGARIAEGGTAGMLGMVISGEADIAVGYVNWALNRVAEGAPLGVAPLGDGVIPIHVMTGCIPALTKTDPALAQLFLGWRVVRGTQIQDDFFGTGSLLFEDFSNPVTQMLAEAGIQFPENAATYRTREQTEFHRAYGRALRDVVAAAGQ